MLKAALISTAALIAACSAQAPQPLSGSPGDGRESTLHAIHDERLHGLMADLNSLNLSEKEMTEHARDLKRRDYTRKIAEGAESMAKNIDAVVDLLPSLNLTQTEHSRFQDLAQELAHQSLTLKELATANHRDAIPRQLDEISATCKACHQLFRPSSPSR